MQPSKAGKVYTCCNAAKSSAQKWLDVGVLNLGWHESQDLYACPQLEWLSLRRVRSTGGQPLNVSKACACSCSSQSQEASLKGQVLTPPQAVQAAAISMVLR